MKKSVCLDQFRFLEFEAGDGVVEDRDAEVFYIRGRTIISARLVTYFGGFLAEPVLTVVD